MAILYLSLFPSLYTMNNNRAEQPNRYTLFGNTSFCLSTILPQATKSGSSCAANRFRF